jgi:HSP20 family protein
MALIPWKPFSDWEKFFEEEDWLLPILPRSNYLKPAINLKETEKEVIAEVEIPGFDPEKVDISLEDGVLKVSGQAEEKKEEKEKGYWRKEIYRGSFERRIRLPVAVKEDKVEAVYDKGILRITMPKVETKPSSKIKVKVKSK